MKSKIIFILFLSCVAVRSVHGQTINELFTKLPESLLPLHVSDRASLINRYKADEKATVENYFGDSCSILRLTDDYIQIKTGKSTMELFLLPMINDSKIVGLIQTVCAPVCDSYLEFYTTAWKKLDTSVFIFLADKYDFLNDEVSLEEEKVTNALIPLDIPLMQLHYEPEKQELYQSYTTPDYLSEDDRDKVISYLQGLPKRFKWNLIRFE